MWANAQRDSRPAEYRWRHVLHRSMPQSLIAPTARAPCSNAANRRAQDLEDAKWILHLASCCRSFVYIKTKFWPSFSGQAVDMDHEYSWAMVCFSLVTSRSQRCNLQKVAVGMFLTTRAEFWGELLRTVILYALSVCPVCL